jgi:phosphoglycolate phosphatase-like HAD superfamily hydrolase
VVGSRGSAIIPVVGALHIVWDWNGTLLDDLHVVIEAANVSLARFGLGPIDEEDYRDHFTRPVRAFYDSLFGRPILDEEWEVLNDTFHHEYYARVGRASLTGDAHRALEVVEGRGWAQSLLSMSPQEWLEHVVDRFGLDSRFTGIRGLTGPTGGLKAEHLEEHLGDLGVEPERTVVIGDTPDDASAAGQVGARVVLYHGGSHHLPTLEEVGAPIAHTLVEAVELAAEV